jgi:hypothetical protein
MARPPMNLHRCIVPYDMKVRAVMARLLIRVLGGNDLSINLFQGAHTIPLKMRGFLVSLNNHREANSKWRHLRRTICEQLTMNRSSASLIPTTAGQRTASIQLGEQTPSNASGLYAVPRSQGTNRERPKLCIILPLLRASTS